MVTDLVFLCLHFMVTQWKRLKKLHIDQNWALLYFVYFIHFPPICLLFIVCLTAMYYCSATENKWYTDCNQDQQYAAKYFAGTQNYDSYTYIHIGMICCWWLYVLKNKCVIRSKYKCNMNACCTVCKIYINQFNSLIYKYICLICAVYSYKYSMYICILLHGCIRHIPQLSSHSLINRSGYVYLFKW